MTPSTTVEIDGPKFLINGRYTYAGREFEGRPVEGLLLNVRAVQATFDDEQYPDVASYDTDVGTHSFAYPDTGRWDPERNVTEFCEAVPAWREAGVLAATLNFQGGRPIQNAWHAENNNRQPHRNSAFTAEGELKPDYALRMRRALQAMDQAGMAAVVGLFYFGQDYRLEDEAAVLRAVDESVSMLLRSDFRNIVVEVANEVHPRHYSHEILKPDRICELIDRIKATRLDGRSLLVGTSFTPSFGPTGDVIRASDLVLPHGNGQTPEQHVEIVDRIRDCDAYKAGPKPIVFNEAGTDIDCLDAAVGAYASWGYYDHGANNYADGYQSPPVNWGINTMVKRAFFKRVRQITGAGEK